MLYLKSILVIKAQFLLLSKDDKTIQKDDFIKVMKGCKQNPAQKDIDQKIKELKFEKKTNYNYEETYLMVKQLWAHNQNKDAQKKLSQQEKDREIFTHQNKSFKLKDKFYYFLKVIKAQFMLVSSDDKTIKKEEFAKVMKGCKQNPSQKDIDQKMKELKFENKTHLTYDETYLIAKQLWTDQVVKCFF
jgi:Ca2+-binding EF-hand superfamily protein